MDHNDSSEVDDHVPALHSSKPDPKDDDLSVLPAGESGVVYPPPAHLAARFYRSNVNRKRSSNASSRRNSIASSHSHHSSRVRRGIQNHHIAQHLRRASILEDRRARLADRNAHAEQVRMRAAQAKAASKPINTEAKFEAAQQARQKMLAKVAATCAEAVAHAKRVAEETREKRAEAERRSRMELEEKHAEAERRRMEHKKNTRKPRSRSDPTSDGKKSGEQPREALSQAQAATRIQRAWRFRLRKAGIDGFVALDMTIERVGKLGFLEASDLLSADQVLQRTQQMMKLFNLDMGAEGDQSAVRRFLSAYMILGHATEIFPKHGQQEEDLMEKSKELLISFENLLSEITSSPRRIASATQFETLIQAHATYLTAFEGWKSRDATALLDVMVDQFVAFDSIWQTVKDDTAGDVATDYRDAIREQQVILFSKIKKLAGHESASRRIKDAIRESRRQRMRNRPPIGDVRPRPVSTPEGSSSHRSANTPELSESAAQELSQHSRWQPMRDEISRIFSVVPPNRVVVHELSIDPNYRFELSPQSDIRSALNREVCSKMREAVHNGQGELWTVAVAENIRSRLLRLLRDGNSMHRLLSEVLDAEHIRNQCAQGVFSYEKFFGFMADILPKLCAPFRDQEVRALAEVLQRTGDDTDAMIEKLFSLLRVIDLMTLDYSNYLVQQASPALIRQARSYEQREFANDLDSGRCTLERTKRWWSHATLSLLTESTVAHTAAQFNGEFAIAVQTAAGTFARIYSRGLIDFIIAAGQLRPSDVPETLQYDIARLSKIRADLTRFTTVGAIMLTAKNLLRRDVRSQWKPEAKRILEIVASTGYENPDNSLTSRICGIIEATHGMPAASRTHLERATTRFLAEAASGRPPADPVLKLLVQRLRSSLFARIVAATYHGASSSERVRVASSAGEALAGIGLAEFVAGIAACADEASRIASVDLAAHMRWYQDVAREIEQSGERQGERGWEM